MDRLFDDDYENLGYDPTPKSDDELTLSFERYVAEGLELLEEWLRDPF